jgi:hypothetical protein
MLREIKNVKQFPNESKRRCFLDDLFDLTVWLADDDTPVGFQLCYVDGIDKKALTYHDGRGFMHNSIDDGEGDPARPKMIPILEKNGMFNKKRIFPCLKKSIRGLDDDIACFVVENVKKY